MEHQVAPRQIKMPVKDNSDTEAEEIFSQRKRPEIGRYLLQVDRQTKGSYKTSEAAQSAALEIKTEYPIVKVSISSTTRTGWLNYRAPLRKLSDAINQILLGI
jgi:hypothetical protein